MYVQHHVYASPLLITLQICTHEDVFAALHNAFAIQPECCASSFPFLTYVCIRNASEGRGRSGYIQSIVWH